MRNWRMKRSFVVGVSCIVMGSCGGRSSHGERTGLDSAHAEAGGAENNAESARAPGQLFNDVSLSAAPDPGALWINDVDLFDADNDGDLDMLEVPYSGSDVVTELRLRVNDAGIFHDRTVQMLPAGLPVSFTDADEGDLDGDGLFDIVLAADLAGGTGAQLQNHLLLNRGTHFELASSRIPQQQRHTVAVELCDYDSDGDLDIFFAHSETPESNHVLLQNDEGTFRDVSATRLTNPGGTGVKKVLCVELDSPASGSASCGSLNEESCRRCASPTQSVDGLIATRQVSTADASACLTVRAQVRPELVLAATQGSKTTLLRQDASGRYMDVSCDLNLPLLDGTPISNERCSAGLVAGRQDNDVEAGDIDGNGTTDLVLVGRADSRNTLLSNNGRGVFSDVTATRWTAQANTAREVELGDVDGDGDLDVVVLRGDVNLMTAGQNSLFLNESGFLIELEASGLETPIGVTADGDLADYDGDGDLDLVIARIDQPLQVLENSTHLD